VWVHSDQPQVLQERASRAELLAARAAEQAEPGAFEAVRAQEAQEQPVLRPEQPEVVLAVAQGQRAAVGPEVLEREVRASEVPVQRALAVQAADWEAEHRLQLRAHCPQAQRPV
jgi:hypothetical protein